MPPSFAFVGPIAERVPASGWRSPWAADDPRPLIVVSFSTAVWDQSSRIQRTMAGLTGRPYRVLVTAGPAALSELPVPENAALVPYVPHGEVLPEAAAVVTHGGHGTVSAALRHGLPLVCLPNLAADQPGLSARLRALGTGVALDGAAATSADIAHAVETVCHDPTFAATQLERLAQAAPLAV